MGKSSKQEPRLDSLSSRIAEWWGRQHEPFPSVLYHYTSAEGLIGILQSRSMWATDVRYMNDLSELQYARDIVKSRLAFHRAEKALAPIEREFLGRADGTFDAFAMGFAAFSASFCEDGNLLSQWRAYRGRGGGYAIGFDFFHLLRLLDKPCLLRRVVYEKAEQEQIIDFVIGEFLLLLRTELGDRSAADVESDFLPKCCQAFRAVIAEFLPAFKHPDFREEREWRLVYFARTNPTYERAETPPSFRSYEGNVIPYVPISLEKALKVSKDDTLGYPFPIVDVMIGPTINAALNEESIRILLLSINPDCNHRIRHSGIPLRWL